MIRKLGLVVLVLAIVITGTAVIASRLATAQERQRAAGSAALAVVGGGFSYQGQLEDSGDPANGSYDFQFSLFDDPSVGSQVGSSISQTLPVSSGLFSTTLDFGDGAFNGEARYLEIAVQLSGGGGFTTMSPRQTINAVPYASFAAKVQPLENVVTVAKSGGDYTSVQDALDNISASAGNPYLIRIAPGVYTGTVHLESYVDIEGSGEGTTILRGTGGNAGPDVNDGSATMRASTVITSEIRFLTVQSIGTGKSAATAIRTENGTSSLKFTHITASASGGTDLNYGFYHSGSSPMVNQVSAISSGGNLSFAFYNNNSSSPLMNNVSASASDGNFNYGIVNVNSSPAMTNVNATGVGGTFDSYAIYNTSSSPTMTNINATAEDAAENNTAIYNNSGSSPTMTNVTATASGPDDNVGVDNNGSSSPAMTNVTAVGSGGIDNYGIKIRHSSSATIRDAGATGSTLSIDVDGTSSANVANSMLNGSVGGGGSFTCIGVYTNAFVALNGTCQ